MSASSTKMIRIAPIGFHSAISVAAGELGRYLPRLAPLACRVLAASNCPPETPGTQILLGTSEHLNPRGLRGVPTPSDSDDGFLIKEFRTTLYLIGSNPRSVLYAAYHLLEHFGVRFVRPGSEIIPRRKRISWKGLHIRENASYRHRGICIEGAPRLEHVLGILDWMAKKKMNTYQLQFRHAGVFWRAGYALQAGDSAQKAQPPKGSRIAKTLTDEDCYSLDERVIQRCHQLGFLVHRVGHGWTSAAVGTVGMDWEKTRRRVPRSLRSQVALVNGQRAFFGGVPTNTELCYSNPAARDAFASEVVQYARRHSEVDVIHAWLSDTYNNNCECDACARKSLSDWYAILINEICERLEAEGLAHKIVFLAYSDITWPPDKEQVTHPQAILMFAPCGRCYVHPLMDARCSEDVCLERPELNRRVFFWRNHSWATVAKSWAGKHPGRAFLFDYHLYWACWNDGWGCDVGRVMAQDMKHLDRLGLDGLVSCQTQRCFWPQPHTMHAMADMLWNRSRSAAAHRRKVFADAYGQAAQLALEYWNGVVKKTARGRGYDHKSVFFSTDLQFLESFTTYTNSTSDIDNRGAPHYEEDSTITVRLKNLAVWLTRMQRTLANAAGRLREPAHRDSLRLLAAHASLTSSLAAGSLGALAGSRKRFDKAREQARRTTTKIIRKFDPWVDPQEMPAQVEAVFEKMRTEASKEYPRLF